ncbi:MAG: DNA methyltransferase [Chloroflexota bacterium]
MKTNVLYFGDNLTILRNREYFPDECVDLIYLDPPFNSKKDYNVLFKENGGVESEAQIKAFTDTWHWGENAQNTYHDIQQNGPMKVGKLIYALYESLGQNDVMAYLVMMTARLIELHRVLKPTGSLYLHCDPAASHYLKIVLDQIFSPGNFRNEIVWRRSKAHNKLSRQYGPIHDTILFYSKSAKTTVHPPRRAHFQKYVEEMFSNNDEKGRYRVNELTGSGIRHGDSGKPWKGYDPTSRGRHWAISAKLLEGQESKSLTPQEMLDVLDSKGLVIYPRDMKGLPRYKQYLQDDDGVLAQDIWAYVPYSEGMLFGSPEGVDEDVRWLESEEERMGFQTQKPLGLLERIISASSNEGDIVLDPFCGCGTAVVAAQKLNRKWLGIDVTHLAINLMRNRLRDSFGIKAEVIGEPADLSGAKELARNDRYQFQFWATGLIGARPVGEKKKGADAGIDGVITFIDDTTNKPKRVIVQVKSGHVGVATVRELADVSADEAIGVLITLEPPTEPMRQKAMSAGYYHSPVWNKDYDKIQILTVEELLGGRTVNMPQQTQTSVTFAKAPKITAKEGEQLEMGKE